MGEKTTSYFIIGTFVTLYLLVSGISTIHVIDFFKLSNPNWLAVSLALAFEVGAAASLASIITLDKMNKGIVWGLFIILTLMQAMGNTYYAYTHLDNFQSWVELFGLTEENLIYQKRVLSIVSGAILPAVALGFIKSLVDYIKPSEEQIKPEIGKKTEVIEEIGDWIEKIAENNVDRTEEKTESLEEKTEAFVDGGDSNEPEPIAKTITEPVSEYIESIKARRYGTAVEVDPLKIN